MLANVSEKPFREENRIVAAYFIVAIIALALGVLLGLFQALEHAGINLYPPLSPILKSYYQGLTLHGVLNVLVWTTFFICGFLTFVTVHHLKRPLASLRLGWFTFWMVSSSPLGLPSVPRGSMPSSPPSGPPWAPAVTRWMLPWWRRWDRG